jgi:hypothetical protein
MPRKTSPIAPIAQKSPSIKEFIKAGFGLGIGSVLAFMMFIAIAACFFVPGFIIVTKQQKKPKEERSTGLLVLGYILMGVGMIVGLGFGAGVFFGSLSEDL